MNRRGFLAGGLGAAAVTGVTPGWSGMFAAGARDVKKGIERAREQGKPLLVLVVPAAQDEQYDRQQAWSELLTFADDATLAELALCEVVCARIDDAAAGAKLADVRFPEVGDDAAAVLLETDQSPSRTVSAADLPAIERGFGIEAEPAHERSARARTKELAERLRAAILPDATALARRAKAAKGSLDMNDQMRIVLDHAPRPRLGHLDRGAAIVLWRAREEGSAEQEANLARAALQRLWEESPDGATWNSSTGFCPPCGMGHTPDFARHFLSFYAK